MRRSYLIAIAVAGLLALWVGSGVVFSGDETEAPQAADTDGEDAEPFAVRVRDIAAETYTRRVDVSGRTEALRAVELKAEVDGRVVETPVEKGDRVDKGALLCRLAADEREADLEEARALVDQRQQEYKAAQKLSEKGHRSSTQLAEAKAQYEAAKATLRQREVALENTTIEAPFAGLVEDRPIDIGDYLQRGESCARLVDEDPFLVIGEVSERQVGALSTGSEARVELTDGRELTGRIRFIAGTASERTRTFRIEVAVDNPQHTLREGLSAEISVPVASQPAHFVPTSVLVLDSHGRMGVRNVDEDGVVRFHPMRILEDTGDGLWVAGLPQRLRIITVGQGFVTAGEEVRAVPEDAEATS